MEELSKEERLEAAIKEVNTLDKPNYSALAIKWDVHRSTLSRRHRGVTVSRTEATSIYHKLLTDAQEELLLQDIETLGKAGLYLTPRIIQNTVEGLVQHEIGDTWVYSFLNRYQDRIASVYIGGYDQDRKVADNADNITQFYAHVTSKHYYFIKYLLI
jgi:hypothetical protein